MGIPIPVSYTDAINYPDYRVYPFDVSSQWDIKRLAKKAVIINSTDMNRKAQGMQFFSCRNRHPVLIDGTMSEKEKRLDLKDPQWTVLTGEQGTYILMVDFSPAFKEQAQISLYYRDDGDRLEPPENEPGQTPELGYELDISHLKKGTYSFKIYSFYPETYQAGDETAYQNILRHPLQTVVRYKSRKINAKF